MKKLLFAALIGLVMACTKEDDTAHQVVMPGGGIFAVETGTKFDHKFPHRGRIPFEILGEEYTFLGKSDVVTGLISTNYGEIPLSFPRLSGLTVKSQIIRDDLGGFDEFFLDGGYILLDFYFENNLLMEDSIRFDIIAPSEDIEAWESRGLK